MIEQLKQNPNLEYWFAATSEASDAQQEQLYRYFELIAEYNKVMNLTGIDDLEGVYLKHFYDSITVEPLFEQKSGLTIADLGTGAGMPGIILAIIYNQHHYSLIEPLTKRCKFLQIVVDDLGLENVEILNERAEDIDDRYDIVVSRAVSQLNILSELSIPLVKEGGLFIPLKGAKANEELKQANQALRILGAKVEQVDEIVLPFENSKRANIKIRKVKATPKKYPRNFGQIKKKPL